MFCGTPVFLGTLVGKHCIISSLKCLYREYKEAYREKYFPKYSSSGVDTQGDFCTVLSPYC
jgi:hypothetical protein